MKRPRHSVADLNYLAMKIGKWPNALFYIFIHLGHFLLTNGKVNFPKWSDQVETQLRLAVPEMPEDIEAKLSFDKDSNAIAISMRIATGYGKLSQETLLIYNFEKDTNVSITGHKCTQASSIKRGKNSIQFLDDGNKLKDFGSFVFFDAENYAEHVSEEWTESDGFVTKFESLRVPINGDGLPSMNCNLTHYISNVNKDIESDEAEEKSTYSNILKIEGLCELDEPDEDSESRPLKIVANFFSSQNSISNPEVFQQPPGVYCPSVKTVKNYPPAPAYFSFNFLTFDADNELGIHFPITSFRKKIWYDSPNKLVRKDNLNWDFDIIVTTISDFNSKLSYIIISSGECTVNELKSTDTMESEIALPGENFPMFPGSTTDAPQYVGQRKRYGITFDVWVSRNKIDETLQVSDYYFTENVLSEDNTNVTSPAFIEMFIFNTEGMLIGNALQLISEYRTKPSIQDQSTFDVTTCFPETNKTRFSLSFKSKDDSDLGVINQASLINEVRKKLLSVMKISKMRLGAVQISYIDENLVTLVLVLSEDPTRLGYKQGAQETSNKEAMKALDELINDKNLLISVDTSSKKITMTATKLNYPHKNDDHKDDKDKDDKDTNTKGGKHGFSGGALAGVGIAMLAVGMFQGIVLLVAYIRYRRNDPLMRRLTASEDPPEAKTATS